MIRLYAPDVETTGVLGPEDSAHCCRVLRMREGDRLHVVDGRGGVFVCEILDADPRRASLAVVEKTEDPTPWFSQITLAVAPTKNMDRMEWLIEKSVEIGIGRFVPLICRRSERKVLKTERLRKIAVSAMKQSLKSHLPVVEETVTFKDFMKSCSMSDDDSVLAMGYCSPEVERCGFADLYPGNRSLTLLIGPEGDFAPEEVCLAMDTGFVPVSFGSQRLRTETAALYGVTAAHVISDLKNASLLKQK